MAFIKASIIRNAIYLPDQSRGTEFVPFDPMLVNHSLVLSPLTWTMVSALPYSTSSMLPFFQNF